MSAIHGLLANIPVDLPFEKLLVDCQGLYEEYPPHVLEKEVKENIRRQEEEMRAHRERRAGGQAERGHYLPMFRKILVYGAPVIVGIVLWRYYQVQEFS